MAPGPKVTSIKHGKVIVIRLRRIYNFWLFHANIIQFPLTFRNFLYDLFGLTYLSSAQCQFLFVACFCITENPYQKKSKRDATPWRIILEYLWILGVGITANRGPHIPRYTKACPWRVVVGASSPVRRLELYFGCKEAYIRKEIM